jgi:hypothetical protein
MSDEIVLPDDEEDYRDQQSSTDESATDTDPGKRKIVWQPKDFTLQELKAMRDDRELDLRPEYQRNFVFDIYKASKLIESILLDVPIPVIYVAEEGDFHYSVIDGQQRLTSFLSFMDGQFPSLVPKPFKLAGLGVLTELNGKTWADLDKPLQLKIKKTALHTIVIKNESDEDIKFEIFERLNTGSIKLNEDEIRNTLYRGPYIDLLAALAEDKHFTVWSGRKTLKIA